MLTTDEKIEVRSWLHKFNRNYDFLTHIIRFEDERLHKFSAYARLLVRKLRIEGDPTPHLEDEVALQYFRLQEVYEGSIELQNKEGELANNPDVGSSREDEKDTLSNIINRLNERLRTNFTHMDKVIEQVAEDLVEDEELRARAHNSLEMFSSIYADRSKDIVLKRMEQNQEFVLKYFTDAEFRAEIDRYLMPLMYQRFNETP